MDPTLVLLFALILLCPLSMYWVNHPALKDGACPCHSPHGGEKRDFGAG